MCVCVCVVCVCVNFFVLEITIVLGVFCSCLFERIKLKEGNNTYEILTSHGIKNQTAMPIPCAKFALRNSFISVCR